MGGQVKLKHIKIAGREFTDGTYAGRRFRFPGWYLAEDIARMINAFRSKTHV